MKLINLFFLFFLIPGNINAQSLVVKDLTVEYKINPVGIDVLKPRFSWKIEGSGNDIMQTAYSLRVATGKKFSPSQIVWKSGMIPGDGSVLQEYAGSALKSGQRYYWEVKIRDNKGRESRWSEPAFFEMGLLSPSDWKARWIEMDNDTGRYSPSPHFRKEFKVTKQVAKAVIYATSHGFYELSLNGKKVGDQVLTPGWTSYGKRLQYQTYDVTGQINKGDNAIGAVLGDGWYRGTLAWNDNWGIYGKKLGVLLQLRLIYTDGTESLVVTDGTWKCNNDGAIRMSDIYNGETYDATKKLTGWNMTGYDDSNWKMAGTVDYHDNLVALAGVPVRKTEEIKPVRIFRTPKGSLVADMGQNMVGWVRLKVSGPRGTVVTLRHAEVLDKYGEFYTKNLRAAKCRLTYTLSGSGEEIYEPRFTFMGFRFVEVTGFPGVLTPENITGIVVHSDMQPSGTFECSDPMVNKLQDNIVWGQKGNFVDVPTDCPQRDERLGWTGDAQAFCRTASFNFDVSLFFTKWLGDVALDQKPGGEIPVVIPDVIDKQGSSTAETSAGWGDVAVIAPWTMYMVYGDKRLLEKQYPSMKAWVEYIRRKAGKSMIWKSGSIYGDWLFYHPPVNNHTEPDGFTEHDFIATAFYAYSTSILAEAARELGKSDDEKMYNDLFGKIRKVFIHEYVTPAGRVGTDSQTSYILALMFNLLPDELRTNSAAFLAEDVKSRGNHLSTGFLGTPFICHVLTQAGYSELAYDLLLQKTYPSWLYPVSMGATTIWERWDGQKPDSTFQDEGMNSFNHYAYGAIGDWMYRESAGLDALTPGYKHLLIHPHITTKLTYSRATFESPYGKVSSGWERNGNSIIIKVTVPANTIATVVLPAHKVSGITVNGKDMRADPGMRNLRMQDNGVAADIGSGNYVFEFND